jgi:hypothetical protein
MGLFLLHKLLNGGLQERKLVKHRDLPEHLELGQRLGARVVHRQRVAQVGHCGRLPPGDAVGAAAAEVLQQEGGRQLVHHIQQPKQNGQHNY